jgi:predicted permease
MKLWRRVGRWLRAMVQRPRVEREMDAELRFHVEAHAEDLVRNGVAQAEALRRARLEFGGVEQTKEVCRDARGVTVLNDLIQDLRLGTRVLSKNPGFTTIAVLTLALGIAANTAIFSVVDAILLRPLPYPKPTQLVRLWESAPSRGYFRNVVNPFNFLDWRDNAKSFQSMAAILVSTTNLNAQGQPIAVPGMQVSPEFFSVLEVPPMLGRTFTSDDGIAGHDQVVILSCGLWQGQFGGNPAIIGKKIEIEGVLRTVVGVMPHGFAFPNIKAEVWAPLPLARTDDWKGGRYLTVIARLKPEVTLEQAQLDMQNVANITAKLRPDYDKGWSAEAIPMLEDTTQNVRRPLWVLLAAVGFLLLIACANVANLLLMRGTGRQREMAVRSALGAARIRLVQQLLVESLILGFGGMIAGLLIGQFALYSLLALIPENAPLPRGEGIGIDGRVLLFTLLVSLITTVVFGVVPAFRLSRVDPQNALKQGSLRGGVGGHQTLRRCFVMAEVAMALVLSVGAGLMWRSFSRLIAVNPGFNPQRVVTMHISLSPSRYSDGAKRSMYFEHILTEVGHVAGVRAAGSVHFLPLTGSISGSCFGPGDGPPPTPAEAPNSQFLIISPGYFAAMGIPLLQGRDFEERDNFDSRPVAIVNHAFIARYYAGEHVLGKQLQVCWTLTKPVEIVGIAADTRQAELQAQPEPTIFLSNAQAPMYFATLVVRAVGDPRQIARSAEDAIHRVDPDQAVSDVQTMETVLSDSVASPRFQAVLLGVFATLAIALAIIGVYGVGSYSVSQRINEIGIRVAMGACSADIARLVLREALALAGTAAILGVGASLALSRTMESLLFEVRPTDPVTLISVACMVVAVSAVAAVLPAWRATRVDPMVALRYE